MQQSRVMLTLYVASGSELSRRAQKRWLALLTEYDPATFALEIRDVEDDSRSCDVLGDRIAKTPVMIVRGSSSARILGDLEPEHVANAVAALSACGLRIRPSGDRDQ